jgi:hypothetical protein
MMRGVTDWWNRRYPEWVPEIALRYVPIVESICAEPSRGLILEVGANRSGLTTHLRRPAIGEDCHRLAIALVHVRRWLNAGPCYRQIIVAEFEG